MSHALLEKLVAIPSHSGSEQELADFCAQFLIQQGFDVVRQPVAGRENILACKGPPGPALLLLSHLDTVPAGPGWLSNPYQLHRNGDRFMGLGASDMKGGLAVLLTAVQDFQPNYPLKIALTVDEERYSTGAWTLFESEWLQDCQLALVPELSVAAEHETLGLGRRGHFQMTLQCYGKQQHAAMEQPGDNAMDVALDLLYVLRQFPLRTHPHWGAEQYLMRQIHAESAFGLSTPAECRVELACLSLPGLSQTQCLKALTDFWKQRCPQWQGRFTLKAADRPTPAPEAYEIPQSHPAIPWIQASAQQILGRSLPFSYGLSVADENVLARLNIPVFSLAPVGGASHQANEWVSRQSLLAMTGLYRNLLETYLTANPC